VVKIGAPKVLAEVMSATNVFDFAV